MAVQHFSSVPEGQRQHHRTFFSVSRRCRGLSFTPPFSGRWRPLQPRAERVRRRPPAHRYTQPPSFRHAGRVTHNVPLTMHLHHLTGAFSPAPLLFPLPAAEITCSLRLADSTDDVTMAAKVMGGIAFAFTLFGFARFILASTSARITQANYTLELPGGAAAVETRMDGYLTSRRYSRQQKDASRVVTYVGRIQPSRAIAAFLVFCAACGTLAVAAVGKLALHSDSNAWYALALLSPGAWFYYMRGAPRLGEFRYRVDPLPDGEGEILYVKGSRDEIELMEEQLGLRRNPPPSAA